MMGQDEQRREPVFSAREESSASDAREPMLAPEDFPSEFGASRETINHGLIFKVAAAALTLACGLFVADRLHQRYLEQQAIRELNAMIEGFVEQANAMNEQATRQARARQQRLERERANSRVGGWLAKNCSDWRQAHSQMPGPTSRAEMKRHCDLYDRYIKTGVAPPGVH